MTRKLCSSCAAVLPGHYKDCDIPALLHKPSLGEMTQDVVDVNKANGWYDDNRTFGDGIALIHSELSEALEAYREYGLEDMTDVYLHPDESLAKPEGVGSELADVFIRLLDTCARYGIDLEAEYLRKHEFNKTRGYRHGGKLL